MNLALVFPNQLYPNNPAVEAADQVWIVEDELFFTQLDFHPIKLAYHRATMKGWASRIADLRYISAGPSLQEILAEAKHAGFSQIHSIEPDDYLLNLRLQQCCPAADLELRYHDGPGFILTAAEADEEFSVTRKRHFMATFYQRQRRKANVLLEPDGSPVGGKWSFDTENRKKIPKGVEAPPIQFPEHSALLEEAATYIAEKWPHKQPIVTENFPWPVTRDAALLMLEDFVKNRLNGYGDYQDALDPDRPFLWHALLTPALNVGLITPREILDAVLKRHEKDPVPMNALEGFIRQLIGWREYVRGVYRVDGVAERTRNFWGFEAPLPEAFRLGKTGFPPVDDAIRKVKRFAYAHHIERLMVLGNYLLLTETHPDEVYNWFMAEFIDAYDWVMVPNVYGMSQFADGGMMSTKPYISGSNYIRKQSHYKKGVWCEEWDALFWRFVWVHKDVFGANPRMSMMVRTAERMSPEKLQKHLETAEAYLHKIRQSQTEEVVG